MSFFDTAMQTAEEMRQYVIDKALNDKEFRAALIADPRGTINSEYNIQIPEVYEIHVHECSWNDYHIVLPASMELDEDQLEAVSAGLCCCT